MNTYHINIFYSPEDEGFIADIPDLNGCSAFGETQDKAFKEVMVAQKLWLETAKNNGFAIPKPRYRPAIYQVSYDVAMG